MRPTSQKRKFPPPKIHLGDKVRLLISFDGQITGVVVEDRGNIGMKGNRHYVVQCRIDPWNEIKTEVVEENLEAVPA